MVKGIIKLASVIALTTLCFIFAEADMLLLCVACLVGLVTIGFAIR